MDKMSCKRHSNEDFFGILKFLLILSLAFIYIFGSEKALASSADITFETSATDFEVGDIITVEMNISADVYPGDFEGYIQYSADQLSYVSGPEVITGGEGILKINDVVYESDRNTRKYVLKFRALSIGTADISMRQEPSLYEFESGYLMSVSYNTLRVIIGAAETASSDASLKSLKVSPGRLEPEFSNDIKEYTTSVNYDVKKLIVSAVSNSDEATVTIEGNEYLAEGQNRIVIRVKSEDGNENKFVIYCVREKEAAEDKNSTETPTEGASVTEAPEITEDNSEHFLFYATENDGKIMITSDTRYELVEDATGISIPKGFTRTSIVISDIKIPVYSSEEDLSGDFLLIILKKNGGEAALYRYDRVEKTIQRYVSTDVVYKNAESENALENTSEIAAKYDKSVSTLTTIIAILCGICVVLLIVIIRLVILNRSGMDDLD